MRSESSCSHKSVLQNLRVGRRPGVGGRACVCVCAKLQTLTKTAYKFLRHDLNSESIIITLKTDFETVLLSEKMIYRIDI